MKPVSLITIISLFIMSSCNLDSPYASYSNVPVHITSLTVPESGIVSQPVTLTAVASAPDGCWMDLKLILTKKEDFKYDLYAVGNYESHGTCPQVVVLKDTVLTFIPEAAGDYIITTFLGPPATTRRDTVTVTVPGR